MRRGPRRRALIGNPRTRQCSECTFFRIKEAVPTSSGRRAETADTVNRSVESRCSPMILRPARAQSRTTSRTYCRQCGTFIDEVPQDFHQESRHVEEQVLTTTADALSAARAVVADDAPEDLNPEAVEAILGTFTDRVNTVLLEGEPVSAVTLHDMLRESVIAVMDTPDPDSPSSWGFVPTGMVVRGRSQTTRTGRSISLHPKGKPKARSGKGSWRPDEGYVKGKSKAKTKAKEDTGKGRVVEPLPVNLRDGTELDLLNFHDDWVLDNYDPWHPLADCSPGRRNDLSPGPEQYDDWVEEQLRLEDGSKSNLGWKRFRELRNLSP